MGEGVTAEGRGCKEGRKSSTLYRIWKGGCCFPLNQPKVWVFSFHHTHTHKWVISPTPVSEMGRLLSQGIWLPITTRERGGGPISERGRISIYQEKRQGMALAYVRHR